MTIDLGKKTDIPCCTEPYKPKEVYYPTLYIEGGKELGEIPSEGTMTIRYKIVSKSISERDDKRRVSIEVEAREIVDTKSGSAAPSKSREQSLDELAKEVMSDDEDSD